MRDKKVKKRIVKVDPVYKSKIVTRLINKIMRDGKRSIAQNLVYDALALLKEKTKEDPIVVFERAILAVSPRMEVRPRRVGGASYQVPMEVGIDRKTVLALRWIIDAARKRSNKVYHTFGEKLAAELFDATQNNGEAVKKRDTMHRTAEANKAFAHFRW